MTRGVGELTYDVTRHPDPLARSSSSSRPTSRQPGSTDNGIEISLVSILRNHPGSVNPIIKSNNLLNNALAMQEAHRRGGEEALMCNYRGELSECSQSNFFMVRNGVALTPTSAAGLLEGVTRAFLFEVGREVGVEVRDETLYPTDLETADEVFITSTTRELSPVVRIDGKTRRHRQARARSRKKLLDGYRGARSAKTDARESSRPLLDTPRSADTRKSDCDRRTDCRSAPPPARTCWRARTAADTPPARASRDASTSSDVTSSAVCGAFFSTLSRASALPSTTA